MKNLWLLLFILYSLNIVSCATSPSIVPGYDFEGKFDTGDIIKSFEDVRRPKINRVRKLIESNTIIGFSWIDSPLDKITLIKSADSICAVKFTRFERMHDKKPSTTFNSGKESFFAEYEMLTTPLQAEAYVEKEKPRVTYGKFTEKATIGVGRLAFGGGASIFNCGSSKLYWSFPTAIFIMRGDSETFFSPTSIENFDLLDFDSSEFDWYGYDENRRMLILKARR